MLDGTILILVLVTAVTFTGCAVSTVAYSKTGSWVNALLMVVNASCFFWNLKQLFN